MDAAVKTLHPFKHVYKQAVTKRGHFGCKHGRGESPQEHLQWVAMEYYKRFFFFFFWEWKILEILDIFNLETKLDTPEAQHWKGASIKYGPTLPARWFLTPDHPHHVCVRLPPSMLPCACVPQGW